MVFYQFKMTLTDCGMFSAHLTELTLAKFMIERNYVIVDMEVVSLTRKLLVTRHVLAVTVVETCCCSCG